MQRKSMFADIVTSIDEQVIARALQLNIPKLYVLKPLQSKSLNSSKFKLLNNASIDVVEIPFTTNAFKALKHYSFVATTFNEQVFNVKKPMLVILDWGFKNLDGLHQRRSCLNQVLAKQAVLNNKVLVFPVRNVLNANDKATVLGRAMQDAKLVQKYGCEFLIATLASNAKELHTLQTLKSFALMLGFTEHATKQALEKASLTIDKYL